MTIRYAVASGNWSSTATWNGGTLPAPGDDVYANGFTVSINQSIDVKSLKRLANSSPTIASGGTFNVTASATLTVTDGLKGDDHAANSSALVNITTAGVTVTINGNLLGGSTGSNRRALTCAVNATITINGNVTGGGSAANVPLNLSGGVQTITINGTVTGGDSSNAISVGTASTLITVVGAVVGGASASHGIAGLATVRLDAALRWGPTGCAPVHMNGGATGSVMFMRTHSHLSWTAPSDDNWPLATGADIVLAEGSGTGRYTLAVGDSAVTPG